MDSQERALGYILGHVCGLQSPFNLRQDVSGICNFLARKKQFEGMLKTIQSSCQLFVSIGDLCDPSLKLMLDGRLWFRDLNPFR